MSFSCVRKTSVCVKFVPCKDFNKDYCDFACIFPNSQHLGYVDSWHETSS